MKNDRIEMNKIEQAIGEVAVARISAMAFEVWPLTYKDVLSQRQIDFMLTRNYTTEALARAIDAGQVFYMVTDNDVDLGFISVHLLQDKLRIEKLYLMPRAQGRGIGKELIAFAARLARQAALPMLELNVNRGNLPAYHFYLKQGFEVTATVDIPYYDYVLDDYIMQKVI